MSNIQIGNTQAHARIVSLLDDWCDLTEPLVGSEPPQEAVDKIMELRVEMEEIIGLTRMDTVRRARMAALRYRDGDKCQTCGKLLDFDPANADQRTTRPIAGRTQDQAQFRATLDHVKPKSRGGTSRLTNLVLFCQPCNSRKGNTYQEAA